MEGGHFRCFWSLDSGWGEFEMTADGCELRVLYGELTLQSLHLPFLTEHQVSDINFDGTPVPFNLVDGSLNFDRKVQIGKGKSLRVRTA